MLGQDGNIICNGLVTKVKLGALHLGSSQADLCSCQVDGQIHEMLPVNWRTVTQWWVFYCPGSININI